MAWEEAKIEMAPSTKATDLIFMLEGEKKNVSLCLKI